MAAEGHLQGETVFRQAEDGQDGVISAPVAANDQVESMQKQQHANTHQQAVQDWSNLPNPVLKAIGNFLDINSCLASRLVCQHWCQGVSDSVHSLILTPAMLVKYGPQPIIKALQRMPHLEGIDVAVSPSVPAAAQRSYTPQHLQQLLSLIAQHGPQKLPVVFTFAETMQTTRDSSRALQLPAVWRDSFKQGLAELGPRLTNLRISDNTLFQSTPLEQLSSLQYLELNLHRANGISWDSLSQLPSLHSLLLSPPISPCSSGLGPEHAQQVVPTLLSFTIPVKQLLQGLASNPDVAGRMKQLLLQQTGTWDEPAVELLQEHFTGLEALRMFPGPSSPEGLWDNLTPVSRMTKLKELQLVGYSPVSFSNGSATGEALSASLKSLKTLELLIEPESDQVAAVAALTQLTRLKIMLQPRNVAEMVHQGAEIGVDLQGLLHGLHGLVGQLGQQQPQEGAPAGDNQMQQMMHDLMQNVAAMGQQQQPPGAAVAAAGAGAGPGAVAGHNVVVVGQFDDLPGGPNVLFDVPGMAAQPAGAPAAAAAAVPQMHIPVTPAAGNGADGPTSSSSRGRSRGSSASRGRGLGRGLGRGSGLGASSTTRGSNTAAESSAAAAAAAAPACSGGRRRPVSSSRVAAKAAGGSSRRSSRSTSRGAAAAEPAREVSSYALDDIQELMFSSGDEASDTEQQQQQHSEQAGAASSHSTAAAAAANFKQVRDNETDIASEPPPPMGALGDIPDGSGAPSDHESLPDLVCSGSSRGSSSSSNTELLTDSDSGTEEASDESDHEAESSSQSDEGPPALVRSDSFDVFAHSGSRLDKSPCSEDSSLTEAYAGSSSEDGEQQQQQPPGGSSSSGQAQAEAQASANGLDGASSSSSSDANAAAAAAEGVEAAAVDDGLVELLPAVDVPEQQALVVQPPVAGAAAGAAAHDAAQQQQQQPPPGMEALWGVYEGSIPSHLDCLHPLRELSQLRNLELLSPVIPITDEGLEPIWCRVKMTPNKASDALMDVMHPALPQLKSLTLSGAIHIGGDSYRWIRHTLPDLQDLILVHARPGDAPFDMMDAAAGLEGLGPGAMGGLGGLGPVGGLAEGGGAELNHLGGINFMGMGMPGGVGGPAVIGMPLQVNMNGQMVVQIQQGAGEPQQQQQQHDGAGGQQQQQQLHGFGNFMQHVLQQVMGPQGLAGAAGAAQQEAAAAAGQQAPAAGQQQQQQQQGIPGLNLPPGVNIDIQIHQVPMDGGPPNIQHIQFPAAQAGGQHPVGAAAAAALADGQQQPPVNLVQNLFGGLGGPNGLPAALAAAAAAAHGNNQQQQQQPQQLPFNLFPNMFGPFNAQPAQPAAGGAADGEEQQQQPLHPLQQLFGPFQIPPQAAAAAAQQPQANQQQPAAAAAAGNGPAAGPGAAALPAELGNLFHHHHHHHHHHRGAEDPADYIAPHKISMDELPPGLKQLQLVNVGIKSSKTPLPCPELRHLQIERCKGARAFRLPALDRCTKLTCLQLVNVHLEPHTISLIARSCPHLQRLCLTDFKAFAASAPTVRTSRFMPLMMNPQQQQQDQGNAAGAAAGPQQQQPAGIAAGMVSEVFITSNPQESGPAVDWSPVTALRCLNQLSLKSSARHVLQAAKQLGSSRHHIKTLKLEAQGLKVAEVEVLGNQLVVLPHLTWLALVLQYKPDKKPARPSAAAAAAAKGNRKNSGMHLLREALADLSRRTGAAGGAAAGLGSGAGASSSNAVDASSSSSNSSNSAGVTIAQQQQSQQGAQPAEQQPLPLVNGAAASAPAHNPAAAAGGNTGQDAAVGAEGADAGGAAGAGGPAGVGGSFVHGLGGGSGGVTPPGPQPVVAWPWEPANALGRKLAAELPGTALELKVRPHSRWF